MIGAAVLSLHSSLDLNWLEILDKKLLTINVSQAEDSDLGLSAIVDKSKNKNYRIVYTAKIKELVAEDDTAQFALIDLTGNNVPELVDVSPLEADIMNPSVLLGDEE